MDGSDSATTDRHQRATAALAPPLWFDTFEVQPAHRQVRREGQVLPVHARAYDLLMALLERHERTVSKSELMTLIWPDTYVVENNLQVHISALRKLLGHGVIATVPGRGYRFVARQLASPTAAVPTATPATGHPALLGRDQAMRDLAALMACSRLVTVLGAGGIGKTALATAMWDRLRQQGQTIGWVDLGTAQSTDPLPALLAHALDAPLNPAMAPVDGLARSLAGCRGWLVLDNAEHLITPLAPVLVALLEHCPGLHLLLTSQAPMKLPAERPLNLPPLALPPSGEPAAHARLRGSLALFEREAQRWLPHFNIDDHNLELVRDICCTLQGLPLAIQLAAAHCHLLGLEGLRRSLDDRFLTLVGRHPERPTRQHTLQATLQWSHALLEPTEQQVFRRLAAAVGSLSLELAAGLAADKNVDLRGVTAALATLVERSLIQVEPGPRPRYRLSDSARSFGLQQLAARQEHTDALHRHAQAVLALIQPAQDAYIHMTEASWLEQFCSDMDNLRAAICWATEADTGLAVRLLGAAARIYQLTGLFHEALPATEALAGQLNADCDPMSATGFWVLRWNALQAVDRVRAEPCYWHYLDHARLTSDPVTLFLALCAGTALGPMTPAQREQAVQEMQQLLQPTWPIYLHTGLWLAEAMLAVQQGRLEAARPLLAQMADACRTVGKARFAAHALSILAHWDMAAGAHEQAVVHAQQAVALQRELGVWNLMLGLRSLAGALTLAARWDEARSVLDEWLTLLGRADWYGFHLVVDLLALHCAQHRASHAAAQLMACADASFAPDRLTRDPAQRQVRQALSQWCQRGARLSPALAVLLYQSSLAASG
jgi:predicted ATPase/DNA-binding winged helix-turn-helix (wHTH) protein